jgi:tetratricopeptide (TPR) repeat protein
VVQFSAAGYAVSVAGIDEASARFTLAQMQDQLARDPVTALGIGANASTEDVRSAFLTLTKQYHPVRFGRMAPDIQKLSNEVFLALRAAHDALAKAARPRRGSVPPATVLAPIPPSGASGSGPTQSPTAIGSHPTAGRPAPQTAPRPPARAASPGDPGERSAPAAIPVTPSGATRPPIAPLARPAAPPARGAAVRPLGNTPPATARDESAILDLLQRQQWDQARTALHQLSARDPGSKRIRALVCYARGREAQLAGRLDDARVELQDALDLDPDLQAAKTALTELFTRRK